MEGLTHGDQPPDRHGKQDGAAVAVPHGPRGERRPADVIGNAVHVARIATGEIEDTKQPKQTNRAKGGRAGGAARKAALSPERRKEIARAAAAARWR